MAQLETNALGASPTVSTWPAVTTTARPPAGRYALATAMGDLLLGGGDFKGLIAEAGLYRAALTPADLEKASAEIGRGRVFRKDEC